MTAKRNIGSSSKRAVVYKRPNEPRPALERNAFRKNDGSIDHFNFGVQIFYLTGDPTRGDGYTQADGYTLSEYVKDRGGYSQEVKGFPERKFRSQETLINWLNRQRNFAAELIPDGILIKTAYNGDSAWKEAQDYRAWLKGEVYGVALVDDPHDDTGSTLYVNHPRDVPGTVIKRSKKPFYGREAADRLAENTRQEAQDDPEDYYFCIEQRFPENGVNASRARVFGYDGRRMRMGEYIYVNGYRIQRVPAPERRTSSSQRRPTRGARR